MLAVALPRIAVTMGDPAGIGPEICLRLLKDSIISELCVPIVFGDAQVLQRVSRVTGLPEPRNVIPFTNQMHVCRELDEPSVLHLPAISAADVRPGHVNQHTGLASYTYLEAAIEAALNSDVDGLTTGPLHKRALFEAGICYPGHTEILVARSGAQRACMMLTSAEITCSLVTTHVGYREVPELLSEQRIFEVIELSHEAMQRLRGRPPKLTVCGLNPHAGEEGLFGDCEEERLIRPAIEAARDRGMDVQGPLPADTAFLPRRRQVTDCFVCMYHDQGLIPLKALAFDTAVNVTLGLPFVRTSVDHGTACDIAWQGTADARSLLEAICLAANMAKVPSWTVNSDLTH